MERNQKETSKDSVKALDRRSGMVEKHNERVRTVLKIKGEEKHLKKKTAI